MRWHLLVHSDEDVLAHAKRALIDAAGDTEVWNLRASNLLDAREFTKGEKLQSCRLVVVGAATPENPSSSVGQATREPTKDFIKELRARRADLPIIVLTAVPDDDLYNFMSAFEHVTWIAFTPSWRDLLTARAREMLARSAGIARSMLELEVTLNPGPLGAWQIERRGQDPIEDGGELFIDPTLLGKVIEKSQRLEGHLDREDWMADLAELSDLLWSMLFRETSMNITFWRKLFQYRTRAGGLSNVRIRFTVNDKTHLVLVEALKETDDIEYKDYWMLKAPIFRRYQRSSNRYPLFEDRASRQGPIDCLIIGADPAPGNVWNRACVKLNQLVSEVDSIEQILLGVGAAHGVGKVELLKLGDVVGDAKQLVNEVYRCLNSRRWHIVHFAGHVVLDPDKNRAGLVLSADRDCVLDVENFTNKLPGVQFLFLSSCRSADTHVVARAVEQFVPAILGFRWTVNDVGAARFARTFYKELFDRRDGSYKFLDYAFRDARMDLYQANVRDATWASPVLMMQLKEAETA